MKTVQQTAIEMEILRQGIDRKTLAARAKVKRCTLNALISGACPNRQGRARVEWAIGKSIWCSERDFEARKLLAKILDGDPAQLPLKKIQRVTYWLGWRGVQRKHKKDLICWLSERILFIVTKLGLEKTQTPAGPAESEKHERGKRQD